MSRWLRDKMLTHGYAQVDTVFYPPTYPGTTSILSSINQGVQFISYRGWGDANGWHYPSFHNPDLNSVLSYQRMPIVFSIVCNTGDFANSVNPCFGEKWMRMGSVSQPNGCVAFVGPSVLHTKTRLNNSISSGAFAAFLDNGVRGFGSSVLIGKIELYKNFPNDLARINTWLSTIMSIICSLIPASICGCWCRRLSLRTSCRLSIWPPTATSASRREPQWSYRFRHQKQLLSPMPKLWTALLTCRSILKKKVTSRSLYPNPISYRLSRLSPEWETWESDYRQQRAGYFPQSQPDRQWHHRSEKLRQL